MSPVYVDVLKGTDLRDWRSNQTGYGQYKHLKVHQLIEIHIFLVILLIYMQGISYERTVLAHHASSRFAT